VTSDEIIFTTARICEGKIVFFIRLTLLIIDAVDPDTISAKTNQLVIPVVSQTTKGTSPEGLALNPILKTTQKTEINTSGGIKVQTTPRVEPTY